MIYLKPVKHVTKQIQVNIRFKETAEVNWSKKDRIEGAHSYQSPGQAYFIVLSFLIGFLYPVIHWFNSNFKNGFYVLTDRVLQMRLIFDSFSIF